MQTRSSSRAQSSKKLGAGGGGGDGSSSEENMTDSNPQSTHGQGGNKRRKPKKQDQFNFNEVLWCTARSDDEIEKADIICHQVVVSGLSNQWGSGNYSVIVHCYIDDQTTGRLLLKKINEKFATTYSKMWDKGGHRINLEKHVQPFITKYEFEWLRAWIHDSIDPKDGIQFKPNIFLSTEWVCDTNIKSIEVSAKNCFFFFGFFLKFAIHFVYWNKKNKPFEKPSKVLKLPFETMKYYWAQLVRLYAPGSEDIAEQDYEIFGFYNAHEVVCNVKTILSFVRNIFSPNIDTPWARRQEILGPVCIIIKGMLQTF